MVLLCIHINWINLMVSCWLWTNRWYVGIGLRLDLDMPLLCVRCTMTRPQLHTHLVFNYNDNDERFCADVDVNSIWYGMVSWWLWTNRMYVAIGTCLNSNVLPLDFRCTMTPSQFNYNGNDIRLCAHVDINSISYGTVPCWLWTGRQYVGIGTCLNVNA